MRENVLHKLSLTVDADTDEASIRQQLVDILCNTDDIYSYLVYADYIQHELRSFTIELLVSQDNYYNTISHEYILNDVCGIISNTLSQTVQHAVVGYKQPPLDKLLVAFDPLVHSLAREQKTYWKQLEYEDLCQMCRLVICTLYKAGYYVHKNLVRRSFINEVLMSLRKDKYKPTMVSLDKNVSNTDDELLLKDIIPDTLAEQNKQDEEDEELFQDILAEQRELIIEHIGQRQYDRLLSEYGSKCTTTWGQRMTYRLREWLRKEGIAERTFWRKI